MERSEAKDMIADHIANVQGCKSTELAAVWVKSSRGEHRFIEDLYSIIEELIAEKRIMKISYTFQGTAPYLSEKSFYLPGNAKVITR